MSLDIAELEENSFTATDAAEQVPSLRDAPLTFLFPTVITVQNFLSAIWSKPDTPTFANN
ncbi:MAG: hypothetical protein RM368_05715 [Nostoc sp. DedSLP03]|uniref:hypothetical protein n=1 Tax=Nostoc sp. DedSLP03 TaxID=3075400 RepID=UPI002AD53AB4|nr:hypothetical protein [Nostoc sp. DedSLP03]MDZ7964457.1 hypothetical protein [Nostoc sp. DedSLP03]